MSSILYRIAWRVLPIQLLVSRYIRVVVPGVRADDLACPGVSSYRCMFVSCVHPVAVLNDAFCMTYSLLMLVEDARVDHMEEAYSSASLMIALWVSMSVSFCLPHAVVVNVFIICRGLCACTEMM